MKMDEQKTTQTEQETPAGDHGEGVQPQAGTIVDNANAAAERLEAANNKQEELLDRQENMFAKQLLAGSAEAGSKPQEKKKLTDIEVAEAVMRGELNPLEKDGFI